MQISCHPQLTYFHAATKFLLSSSTLTFSACSGSDYHMPVILALHAYLLQISRRSLFFSWIPSGTPDFLSGARYRSVDEESDHMERGAIV